MDSIKPLLMTFSDSDGAGTALYRIHNGLRKIGMNSQLLVRRKSTNDPNVIGPNSKLTKAISLMRPTLEEFPLKYYNKKNIFSAGWLPDNLKSHINKIDPDVIHLNWIAGGFMNPMSLRFFDRPIIWRLPDMWPLTGGCHYSRGCTRYKNRCGKCPQLDSDNSLDASRLGLEMKKWGVSNSNVTVVANSSWLASHAKESSIFSGCSVEVIPNAIDVSKFQPRNRDFGRELFELPKDAPLVVFGAADPSNHRKGYDLLQDALNYLEREYHLDFEVVVFGRTTDSKIEFPQSTHITGYINDEETLSLLYSSADLMVSPSRYEGLQNTVLEAMSCATPVVTFDAAGNTDAVTHQETGYLAKSYDAIDFGEGIKSIIANEEKHKVMGNKSREYVLSNYNQVDIAKRYKNLYNSII